MSAGGRALRAWLHERIGARGPMSFAEFMEAALYHPELGYYCREEMVTGPEGDFYTSPDVDPAFGLLIARQIVEIADRTQPDPTSTFQIVEAGPGTGRLARDIIAGLALERPDLARRANYTLVEISPSLRRRQHLLLVEGNAPVAPRIGAVGWSSWEELVERRAAPGAEPFIGCVVANEYLDALPVHLVQQVADELKEVYVGARDGRFEEVTLPPSTDELSRHMEEIAAREGVRLLDGQRAEVGLRGLDWVSSLGRLFGPRGRGGALILDYGHPARELYDHARHRGTLLCYRRHRVEEDPYPFAGEQDMTAHVDLSSVRRRAAAAGLDVAPAVTQMSFLVSLGLAAMLAEAASQANSGAEGIRRRLAMHALMAPGGMGEVFKVIIMAQGTGAADLTGARDPFRPSGAEKWGAGREQAAFSAGAGAA